MVTVEDLSQTYEEIIAYLNRGGFITFRGVSVGETEPPEIRWAEPESDWKAFLAAAKQADAKIIVVESSSIDKQDIDELQLELTLAEQLQEGKSAEDILSPFKIHVGQVGRISLSWFKDGIKYSYESSTDWWQDFTDLVPEQRYVTEEQAEQPAEIPDEVKKKPEEELADELVEFVRREFPDELGPTALRGTHLFWESKGVSRFPPPRDLKIQLKLEKVESLARRKIDRETQTREKELIPKLVEECSKWARENDLEKITKANVDYFLSEREQTLSKISRDAIYNKVNLILAKQRGHIR